MTLTPGSSWGFFCLQALVELHRVGASLRGAVVVVHRLREGDRLGSLRAVDQQLRSVAALQPQAVVQVELGHQRHVQRVGDDALLRLHHEGDRGE